MLVWCLSSELMRRIRERSLERLWRRGAMGRRLRQAAFQSCSIDRCNINRLCVARERTGAQAVDGAGHTLSVVENLFQRRGIERIRPNRSGRPPLLGDREPVCDVGTKLVGRKRADLDHDGTARDLGPAAYLVHLYQLLITVDQRRSAG